MESLEQKKYNDLDRMSLLGLVRLARTRAAMTWPMHTFIYNNPLHDFEHLDFNEAILQGKRHLGGEGYLPNLVYQNYLKSGRIRESDLDAALKSFASQTEITLKNQKITHINVLRAHMIEGISAPAPEILETAINNSSNAQIIETLADQLRPFASSADFEGKKNQFLNDIRSGLGQTITLSAWCDQTFGSNIREKINQEMIKWCLPFLDEGQAPWPLPFREKGLYRSWKTLAVKGWAFGSARKSIENIKKTPERPTDMILQNLEALGIPEEAWEDYFGLHLSSLPGWTSLIKWRADHKDYAWQEAYPIDLIQYLAIRLWYERQWVEEACQKHIGVHGTRDALLAYITDHPAELFLRKERITNQLPASYAEAVDHLCYRTLKPEDTAWDDLLGRYIKNLGPQQVHLLSLSEAWRLVSLAKIRRISPETLLQSDAEDLKQIINWIDALPESAHGPIWLEALEIGFQENLIKKLGPNIDTSEPSIDHLEEERPHAQAIFCIDARSESFRRHLEKTGRYKTFGFAGFFTVFIRYLAFGHHHETDLFPAVAKEKNAIKEIPRPFQEEKVPRYHAGAAFIHGAHTLLHDLKENVITPYVMVESIGWFFGIPLIGKTLFPLSYQKLSRWLREQLAPPISTTLTVDKLTRDSVYKIIASEQRMIIKEVLRARPDAHKKMASPESIEALRKLALEPGQPETLLNESEQKTLKRLFPTPEKLNAFVHTLREEHFITEAWASARMERITRTGFTLNEQIFTVKTALKMLGFTKNFAKLVLFCGHGSTSENNPYEASLDCGACGGNSGGPNARVIAALANKTHVREHLKKEGIHIPDDTHFIAGEHNTTTDEVIIFDIEDLPLTHKNVLDELILDLQHTTSSNIQERYKRFPDFKPELKKPEKIALEVTRRSTTWSHTRPEWGLSRNGAFLIARNKLIEGTDLEGRVFLHSYRHEEDPTGQFLEIIMTGPLVVAQWINMGYYFSTTDNEVYGSGNKIYHNVAGRVGVMSGATGDLRMGLPTQTLFNGAQPYHEPIRLFTIIEAPRKTIKKIMMRHRVLQNHFNHQWVHLVALENKHFYRYFPDGTWREETQK